MPPLSSLPFDSSPLLLPQKKAPRRELRERSHDSKAGRPNIAGDATRHPKLLSAEQKPPSRVGTALCSLSRLCAPHMPLPAAALAYQTTRVSRPSSRPGTSHSYTPRPDARLDKSQMKYNCHAQRTGSRTGRSPATLTQVPGLNASLKKWLQAGLPRLLPRRQLLPRSALKTEKNLRKFLKCLEMEHANNHQERTASPKHTATILTEDDTVRSQHSSTVRLSAAPFLSCPS